MKQLGGPLAKVGSSAKLCSGMQVISALVPGGYIDQVGSSAKFCVVCKSSLLWYQGGPSAKVESSAKLCVVVCKSSLLWYWGGSIGQSRFIYQLLCSGMQVISALVWGVIGQGRFVFQVWCSSIQGIYSQLPYLLVEISWALAMKQLGGPLAKVG